MVKKWNLNYPVGWIRTKRLFRILSFFVWCCEIEFDSSSTKQQILHTLLQITLSERQSQRPLTQSSKQTVTHLQMEVCLSATLHQSSTVLIYKNNRPQWRVILFNDTYTTITIRCPHLHSSNDVTNSTYSHREVGSFLVHEMCQSCLYEE